MSVKDDYRNEMEVAVEVAQVKLKMLKALTSNLTPENGNDYARIINSAELKVLEIRARLRELDRVHGNTWHQLQSGVEHAWAGLQIALNDVVMSFGVRQ